jgi:hypothetical protein
LGTLGAVLLVTVTLVVASGVWAQTKYKMLYKFNFESNGYTPFASVIFDQAENLYSIQRTDANLGHRA